MEIELEELNALVDDTLRENNVSLVPSSIDLDMFNTTGESDNEDWGVLEDA